MKRDLTPEQLAQQVTLSLPLSAVLRLAEDPAARDSTPSVGRYWMLGDIFPKVGEPFKDGVYAGLTLHDNEPMALVLMPGEENLPWTKAVAWAEKNGNVLPSRVDALLLYKNLQHEFDKDSYYWTSEERAGDAGCAWVAHFSNGYQYDVHESYACRCRAVRRVAI